MVKFTGFAAAAALIATAATPAFAETKPGTPAPTPSASQSEEVTKDRRYCVEMERLGSRLTQKVCRTRAQWLDWNFDPLAPAK